MIPAHPADDRLDGFDRLDGAERQEVLGHVRGCTACRARLFAAAPESAFALLAFAPPPDEALERLSLRVAAALDATAPRAGSASVLPAWASLAAALLLAGTFLGYLALERSAPLERPRAERAESAGRPPAAAPQPTAAMRLLEPPATAQVVDFAVGETRVVMIFDEGLEL